MIRQLNAFAPAGKAPIAAGDGSRAAMDFTIDTGDSADSQQLNETEWVRTLLEGGTLDPNSGIDPTGYTHPLCPRSAFPAPPRPPSTPASRTTTTTSRAPTPYFYDPDDPRGASAGWPEYPGLMDRAQQPFTAAGLAVPSYVVFGNHDGLVQGNQAANASFEQVATGCMKPMDGAFTGARRQLPDVTPEGLLDLLTSNPAAVSLVPPDPKRQLRLQEPSTSRSSSTATRPTATASPTSTRPS